SRSAIARPTAPAPTAVMVAARALMTGTVIATADIRARTVAGSVPPGAIATPEGVVGRIAGKSLKAGDLLLQENLRNPEEGGIGARGPRGQRAFSIRVTEDDIVGGFLQSGDRVDILATIPGSAFPAKDAQDLPDRSQAVLLLQNVLVLAVGENSATR